MATLMKLHISGIRSFGPQEDQAQQIKFGLPVTLILGQNGCGKTTIIECLKYVLASQLPDGCDKGQGFVNDPKMSGASSTKGQIKLKFLDPRGNQITVSKVVEVTQSGSTLKFSSKSATIRNVSNDGLTNSVTKRCTDLKTECCQLMNVSSAILNNVIFCHQENSLWPLDEDKKVKDKFDEIFDAQKYNKCAELFRKELKAHQEKIKLLKVQVCYTKEKKEDMEKKGRQLREKTEKLERFDENIAAKKGDAEKVKKRLHEIFSLEQDLSNLQKNLATKEATKKGIVEEQNTIKRGLAFEFEGSDEELLDRIDSFQKDTQREQNLIAELETRKIEIESKNKVIVEVIQEAQTELGILKEQKKQYEQKCQTRTDLINKAKHILKIDLKGFDNNDGARHAVYELKMELENQEMSLAALIEEKEQQQEKLQEVVNKAKEITVITNQKLLSKQNEMQECEKKNDDISSELMTLSSSDLILADLKKRIDNVDRTVYNLNKTFNETEENKKIENYKQEIQTKDNKLESLNSEYRILQQNDVIEGKMETEKRLVMEKKKEINRIKSKHSNNLKQLFDGTIPEKNLKNLVSAKLKNADLLVKNLTAEITKKQKEVTTLEVQRNNQREKIAACEAEVKANRSKISQACNGKDFNESLNSSFQKKERLQIDKGQYTSIRIIYNEYIKKFEEQNPCCPVCETNFNNKVNDVQKIISNLKSKLNRVPQELTRVENDLKKEEALYNKLQQLQLVNDDTETLDSQKLPEMKQELGTILQNLNKNLGELNTLKTKLTEPQKIVEISNNIMSDVGSWDQNIADVEKSEKIIDNLKQTLVEVESKKSKHEVEADIDFIKLELSELRSKIETTTKNINNHKDRIQQLMQERKEAVDKHVRLKDSMQSKPHLEEQKTELDNRITALKEEINNLESSLSLQEQELERAVSNKDTAILENKLLTNQERETLKKHSELIQNINTLQKEIDDYVNKETEEKLSRLENKLTDYRNKESALQTTTTKIIDAISDKKENIAKEELRYMTLKNNVILREKKTQEVNLGNEIQNLKEQIGGYDYRTLYEEKQRLESQDTTINRQINIIEGEKTGLSDAIAELNQELNQPENRKAYSNYMSKLYELKIAEHAVKDLNKYITALEKSVLEFHKSKMVQINRTIRNLWRNTYRGNDIDHIEIRTEYATSINFSRRSYNYKVVQIKKGIELDMRGRCSAGQKVLACLIIRMALAETLSSNCGILALDEPTTNLDRANVLSLSDTIARIITTRYNEKSFQLLIITHDEEFLNVLTRVQGVHSYYKVDRDKDGFSVITSTPT